MTGIWLKHLLPTGNLQSLFHFLLLTPQSVFYRGVKKILQYCTLMPHPFSPFLITFVLDQGLITSCLGYGICGTPGLHLILFSIIQVLTVENWPQWSLVGTSLVVLHCCTRWSQGSLMWLISRPWSGSCPTSPSLLLAPLLLSDLGRYHPVALSACTSCIPLGFLVSQLLHMLLFLSG